MADTVEIPKGTHDSKGPCWIPLKGAKPAIKCNCGRICHIGLHHVHEDGTVTASFYDSTESSFTHEGKTYHHQPGCGWHVFLKLADYDGGDWPPKE